MWLHNYSVVIVMGGGQLYIGVRHFQFLKASNLILELHHCDKVSL